MVYGYIRFSTNSQDETQQRHTVEEYAAQHNITIDEFERDEGVSGGVSFRNRNLNRLVKKLRPGDVLVVSEISRLGRSMGDLNKLVNDELKPRKIRLIAIKTNMDIDCEKMKATDEILLSFFGFAAQLEKELLQQRTQSAMDARKEWIKKDGGFMSKNGNFCDHLGRKKGDKNPNAVLAMAAKKTEDADSWKRKSPLYLLAINMYYKGEPRSKILKIAGELYEDDPVAYGTREGKPLSKGVLSKWISGARPQN